ARRGADAAGHFGKIIGGMEVARRFLPFAAIDEIVPVRDLIVDRATGVAIRDPAIHAACGLLFVLRLRQRVDELAPMLYALLDRLVMAVLPLVFPENRDFSPSRSGRGRRYFAAFPIPPPCGSAQAP